MNRQKAKELLPIIQAFADGKTVQSSRNSKYFGDNESPDFDGSLFWRIKPVPFETWTNIYLDGEGSEFAVGMMDTKDISEGRASEDCIRTVLLREVTE